jgi:hypothetical protein
LEGRETLDPNGTFSTTTSSTLRGPTINGAPSKLTFNASSRYDGHERGAVHLEAEQCSILLNLQESKSLCYSHFCEVPDTGIPPFAEIYNEFREMLDLAKDSGRDNENYMRE